MIKVNAKECLVTASRDIILDYVAVIIRSIKTLLYYVTRIKKGLKRAIKNVMLFSVSRMLFMSRAYKHVKDQQSAPISPRNS